MPNNGVALQLSQKINILVVDDEPDVLKSIETLYEQYPGVSVKTCRTPEEAINELRKDFYQIVIADENFKKESNTTGTKFIVENKDGLLKESYVILVTGQTSKKTQIENILKKIGVSTYSRDSDWQDVVDEYIEETRKKRSKEIEEFISDKPDLEFLPIDNEYERDVRDICIDWISNLSDQERKIFVMGGKALNAIELSQHVKKGTKIGSRLFRMFKREIRRSFNLKNDNK